MLALKDPAGSNSHPEEYHRLHYAACWRIYQDNKLGRGVKKSLRDEWGGKLQRRVLTLSLLVIFYMCAFHIIMAASVFIKITFCAPGFFCNSRALG